MFRSVFFGLGSIFEVLRLLFILDIPKESTVLLYCTTVHGMYHCTYCSTWY